MLTDGETTDFLDERMDLSLFLFLRRFFEGLIISRSTFKAVYMMIRVSKKDLFLDFEFAHWTDNVFWCKTKNISRIFHSGLVWGWTSPKN